MKVFLLLVAFLLTLPPLLLAQSASVSPIGRTFTELREGERNPFGQQMTLVQQTDLDTGDGGGEEARLRRLFSLMKVSGASQAGTSRRILLGSMMLREGDLVPSILRGQQESLRVMSIDDTRVLLSFVERDPSVEARQILIQVGLEPRVSELLFGEAFEKMADIGPDGKSGLGEVPVDGVEQFLKGSSEAQFENVIDRTFQMLGEVKHETEPEKKP